MTKRHFLKAKAKYYLKNYYSSKKQNCSKKLKKCLFLVDFWHGVVLTYNIEEK